MFRCSTSFRYTKYCMQVLVIAQNAQEAKQRFISACVEKFDTTIKHVDFTMFYDSHEDHEEPLKFTLDNDFKQWLETDATIDIEYLGNCAFELIDVYS